MKRSGAQSRKRRKVLESEAAKCRKMMEGFVRQLPFSAESDGVHVQDDKLRSETSTDTNEIEMNDDNHDSSVTFDEDNSTSRLDDATISPFLGNVTSVECRSGNTPLSPDITSSHDVGHLTFDPVSHLSVIPQSLRDEMIKTGSIQFQNACGPFSTSTGERLMTRTWFQRHLANGSIVNRSWLFYSPLNKAAYCFCCLLFTSSSANCRSAFELGNGFSKWKKPEKLVLHENSPSHRKSFTMWKEVE